MASYSYSQEVSYSSGNAASAGLASFGASSSNGTVNQVANDLLALGGASSFGASSNAASSFGASSNAASSFGASSNAALLGASSGSLSVTSGSALLGNSSQSVSVSQSSSNASAAFLSQIEQSILRATVPIDINETEEITVLGQRGIWANRAEVVNWRGQIPITEYVINEDANPEIITKRVTQQLEYIQELAIRYLRPPTPPAPGEIVIVQEANTAVGPAPPIVIRQQPARPDTPEPLVIREAPPEAPRAIGRKVITISGRRIPPPPRKVIIERLAALPAKPQSVLVERWLPYAQAKRRVVFQNNSGAEIVQVKPRNVIVQWEAPQVNIRKEIKYLGVIRANPVEYVQRYGATLRVARDLPQFVLDINTPEGIVLAANYQASSVYELEGDLQAFRLVDLDREGLSEYRAQLQRLGISFSAAAGGASLVSGNASLVSGGAVSLNAANSSFSSNSSGSFAAASGSANAAGLLQQIFSALDVNNDGSVSQSEVERALLRLNSRLGRNYGENEVRVFIQALDRDQNNNISLQELRAAFERLVR